VPGGQRIYQVDTVIEKPSPTEAETRLLVPGLRAGHYLCFFGMHVLPPQIFGLLDELAAAAVAGAGLAIALRANDIPGWAVLAGGMCLLGMLALAVARYDAAVAVALALFAIVRVEPAPSDAAFAVIILVAVVTGRMNLRTTPAGPAIGVAVFVALNLVACMEAVDPGRAAKFMSITVYLCAFALWVPSWVTSRAHARTLVRVYVGIAVISAALGSLALFVAIPGHDVLTQYTGTRARAFFKDTNVFGPFLVPAALIVMHELLEPRLLRSRRIVKLVLLAVLVAGVLFSYSRAAWLNIVVGVVVMGGVLALRRGGGRRALVFLAVLALAAVTVVVSIRVTGQLDFLQERARFQTYDNQRFGAQAGGIALAQNHPIGIGPGQFELVEPISAHSTYVRALAEQGVLGFVVLVALLYGTLLMALRNVVIGRDTQGIASAALLAAWCGMLANSVFVDTLHWRHLWLVAGLIWAAGAQASSSAGTRLLR
jgi:O-antigen ligase